MSNVPFKQPCRYCVSAFCYGELSPNHDLSYMSVGEHYTGIRMMLRSGARKPVAILVDMLWDKEWHEVASYIPRYCPGHTDGHCRHPWRTG